jgi:hypothetical protein
VKALCGKEKKKIPEYPTVSSFNVQDFWINLKRLYTGRRQKLTKGKVVTCSQ